MNWHKDSYFVSSIAWFMVTYYYVKYLDSGSSWLGLAAACLLLSFLNLLQGLLS